MTSMTETSPRRARWLERLAVDRAAGRLEEATLARELERLEEVEVETVRRRVAELLELPALQEKAQRAVHLRARAREAAVAYQALREAHEALDRRIPEGTKARGGLAVAAWLVRFEPESLCADVLEPDPSPMQSAAAEAAEAEAALRRVRGAVPPEVSQSFDAAETALRQAQGAVTAAERQAQAVPEKRRALKRLVEILSMRPMELTDGDWQKRQERRATLEAELAELPLDEDLSARLRAARATELSAVREAEERLGAALELLCGWAP